MGAVYSSFASAAVEEEDPNCYATVRAHGFSFQMDTYDDGVRLMVDAEIVQPLPEEPNTFVPNPGIPDVGLVSVGLSSIQCRMRANDPTGTMAPKIGFRQEDIEQARAATETVSVAAAGAGA